MTVQFKATTYEVLPTGEYDALLTGIEQAEGEYGAQIRFTFALTDPEHAGRRLTAYARLSESMHSKLFRWCQALLARPIREGETLDLNSLLNRPCTLVVLRATKPDGSPYNRVEDVLPPLTRTAPAQPVQETAPATPFRVVRMPIPPAVPLPVEEQYPPEPVPEWAEEEPEGEFA